MYTFNSTPPPHFVVLKLSLLRPHNTSLQSSVFHPVHRFALLSFVRESTIVCQTFKLVVHCIAGIPHLQWTLTAEVPSAAAVGTYSISRRPSEHTPDCDGII